MLKGIDILKKGKIEAPVLEAGAILCFALNCDKAYLYTHGDRILESLQINMFNTLIEERLRGKPIQYIRGYQEFMSLKFKVNSDVLIPRPETELLVERVIEHVKENYSGNVNILDIGTGSGCIAISLAYYIKASNITAVDISDSAIEVALSNAVSNGVERRIEFVKSNLLNQMSVHNNKKYDIIVSNPPYIPRADIENLQLEVKNYEPLIALDGGDDGLDYYRRIINDSYAYLKPGGLLVLEVGYDQAEAVCQLMRKNYCKVKTTNDLAQIERIVEGFRV